MDNLKKRKREEEKISNEEKENDNCKKELDCREKRERSRIV